MYNNTNPAELYSGTTWELLTSDKYIRTGSTALQQGGSNSVSISKANLPNIKLKVDSFSLTTSAHTHSLTLRTRYGGGGYNRNPGWSGEDGDLGATTANTTSAGGQNTGTASPSTESLGSGTALTIQPAYITLKFWKRLS